MKEHKKFFIFILVFAALLLIAVKVDLTSFQKTFKIIQLEDNYIIQPNEEPEFNNSERMVCQTHDLKAYGYVPEQGKNELVCTNLFSHSDFLIIDDKNYKEGDFLIVESDKSNNEILSIKEFKKGYKFKIGF